MSGIINPKSIVELAYKEICNEESLNYFIVYFIVVPIVLGFFLAYLLKFESGLINYLGTVLAILAGFSVSAIFSLTSKINFEEVSGSEDNLKKFFKSLRLYTSYSLILVIFILLVITTMKIYKPYYIIEAILLASLVQYVEVLFVIIRRVDTVAKNVNH